MSKCSNKALHKGSNYSFKLLRYLCSCYEWGPLACNNYKHNSKTVNFDTHLVGLIWQEKGPSQSTQKNKDIYPCSGWHSNPQSQHSSSTRQYITYAHSGSQMVSHQFRTSTTLAHPHWNCGFIQCLRQGCLCSLVMAKICNTWSPRLNMGRFPRLRLFEIYDMYNESWVHLFALQHKK